MYLIFVFEYMDRVKRIWYLSPMRAAKVQASLRICAVSPELSLLTHTSRESRGTFWQKARSLAPLNGWACTVTICHDGMLEDTNSRDRAHVNDQKFNLIHDDHDASCLIQAAARQNQQNGPCAQRRLISLGIRTVWSEFLLSVGRNFGSLATHRAHSEDWSDWADAGRTGHFVGFVVQRLKYSTWNFRLSSLSLAVSSLKISMVSVVLFIPPTKYPQRNRVL